MCTATPALEQLLLLEVATPAAVRSMVRRSLCRLHVDEALETVAVLLASELATDAVLRGRPPAVFRLECLVLELWISVEDQRPALPAPSAEQVSGTLTGLLMDRVADEYGVTATPCGGRVTWCSLTTEVPVDDVTDPFTGVRWHFDGRVALSDR